MSNDLRTTPRLYIEAPLNQGQNATVNPEQAHYLLHVMRVKSSDALRLFNAESGEWRGSVASISKRTLNITVHEQLRQPQAEPDIWLCCAPIKKAHFDNMIEKATELGVAVIQPVLTGRTQIREVNIERCRAIAIEAAEQSERLTIPDIRKPMTLNEMISSWPKDRVMILGAETGEATPVRDAFVQPGIQSAPRSAIVTGPEGGFAPEEFEIIKKVPSAVFIRLGPRILRADTAAIAALSCWQALCGDWRSE